MMYLEFDSTIKKTSGKPAESKYVFSLIGQKGHFIV